MLRFFFLIAFLDEHEPPVGLSGCAGLVLKDQDTSSERTQKITARALLCVVSLCFSEIFQT